MLGVKKLLKKILSCCYVTGSSGGWTWKKYADGTLDARKTITGSAAGTATMNGAYYATVSGNIPPEFVDISGGSTSVKWGTGLSWANLRDLDTGGFNVHIFKNSPPSESYILRMHISGTWK